MKKILFLFIVMIIYHRSQAQNTVTFNVNNINTEITNNLSPFYNSIDEVSSYQVGVQSNVRPIFNTGLWLGAVDNNDSLYLSVNKSAESTHYGYGPIANDYSNSSFENYNRVWKVTSQEIWAHQQGINTSNSILTWPAHGDVANGEAFYLAPFVDVNGDGLYSPFDGDYPEIKGDELIFFIMNDKKTNRSVHSSVGLGVEIHVMVYGFNSTTEAVNNTVFINYSIYNRSEIDYLDFCLGAFMDADMACSGDDYAGCDSVRNVVYTFDDGDSTTIGMNACLNSEPLNSAIGIKFLNQSMIKSLYFNSSGSWSLNSHYNFIKPNNNQSNYFHPNGVQEVQSHTPPLGDNDIRTVGSVSPLNLPSQSSFCIDFAYVYYENDSLDYIGNAQGLLLTTDTVQSFYDNVNLSCAGFLTGIKNGEVRKVETSNSPNPAVEYTTISFSKKISNAEVSIQNALGQEVKRVKIRNTSEVQIYKENLDSGIYFYSVIDGAYKIGSGKIMFH